MHKSTNLQDNSTTASFLKPNHIQVKRILTVVSMLLLFCLGTADAQTIRYVKEGGTGDGSSWSNASGNLQTMIDASSSNDEVWVAKGTYTPTTGSNRNASFGMKNGLGIYGGFIGLSTETQRFQRNWKNNVTILSGDIGTPNDNSDNSYHVMFNYYSLDGSTVLDGFIITGGNANEGFVDNGAGIYNNAASPVVINCKFVGNSAVRGGGGMYNYGESSPTLINCSFTGNSGGDGGGAIYNNTASSPAIINCSFSGNSANSGGGVYNHFYCFPTLTNCILWGDLGGEVSDGIFSNTNVYNCIVQGGCPSLAACANVLNQDPLFISPANLHLQPCSPAINAGTDAANTTANDLDGNQRKIGTIDLGAYEYQGSTADVVLYVNADAPAGGDGISWGHALNKLQEALAVAGTCSNITQIWVAKGTYYPDEGAQKADNDRYAAFTLKNNLAIYGGFAGTETLLSQRDWKTNTTILNGEIQQDGNVNNNSFRVVFNNNGGLDQTAVLDGFTITGGNANGNFPNYLGGGMQNLSGSPALTNILFLSNTANSSGGGMYNSNNNPTLTNVMFQNNYSGGSGGGMYNSSSTATLINVAFIGNSAFTDGGAMYNYNLSPTLINVSFNSNTAKNGGAMYSFYSYPMLVNCVFWNNGGNKTFYDYLGSGPTATYSLFDASVTGNATQGVGNITTTTSPFVSSTSVALNPCSPAINSGSNTANSSSTDLDGNQRVVSDIIDMGALEYQGPPFTPAVITKQPVAVIACVGQSASFTVAATGSGLTYQWKKGGESINGATGATYSIASVKASDTATYSVLIEGPCGTSISSESARLSINDAPSFTTHPGNVTVCAGSNVTLTAIGEGTNLTYHWQVKQGADFSNLSNTAPYSGVTTNKLIITGASTSLNGKQYRLVASGTCTPAAISNLATVTISSVIVSIPDVKVLSKGVDVNTVYTGYSAASGITLTAMPSGGSGPYTYKWSTGATAPSIKVYPTAVTNYTVTVTDKKNCMGTATKQIKVVAVSCSGKKVNVCHGGNSLCIDAGSVADHLNHGDYLGTCKQSGSTPVLTIQVAPNPSSTCFTVQVKSSNPKSNIFITVFDATGKIVETRTISANSSFQIGSNYRTGTYYLKAVQGSETTTIKLIKQPK